MNRIYLEVCANSVHSAIAAQKGGAIRVELCDNLNEGGTTPALSKIEESRQAIDIQLNTIIRPRGGDYFYDEIEFELMKRDIHHCGRAKCDGIVFGILNKDGSIDKKRSSVLIDIAKQYDMSITFHRAFDRSNNLYEALEDVIELGCDRILTSGGRPTAIDGAREIRQLIKQANNRISIMPGGGVTENNIQMLIRETNASEIHGSFRSIFNGNMEYNAPSFPNEEEYTISRTDENRVRRAIENANKDEEVIESYKS